MSTLIMRISKPALILSFLMVLTNSYCSGQTLGDYLSTGLKNSPFLKEHALQMQMYLIDSLKVLAGYKPQIGVAADLMYPPAIGRFAYDSAITDGGHYAAMVRVDQPLFFKKNARGQQQSIFIQKLTAENNIKITETDLKEAITTQYIASYAGFNQVNFERSILIMLSDQQKVLKRLVEKGIYQQTDYLNLTVNIASRAIAGKQVYRQFKNDLALLNLLCGIHDTVTAVLSQPDVFTRSNYDISSSPNMIRFRIDSLKIINDRLLIDLGYRPRVGVFADAGFNAVNPRRLPYNLGASIGMSFTMPLYDGKQRQLEIKRLSLTEDSRVIYRTYFENRYQQQKDQLLEQVRFYDDLLNDQRNQFISLEKLISLYQIEINKGMVKWLDFLTIINNYAEARNAIRQSETDRLQIINQLNYLK